MLKEAEYLLKGLRAPFYRMAHRDDPAFDCPICGYRGPFMSKGRRLHAKCPRCGELERARLLHMTMQVVLRDRHPEALDCLHVAPEVTLGQRLRGQFRRYVTADLHRTDVDYQCDVQKLPFRDGEFDVIVASHVLQYPEDIRVALRELARVLRPGGVAFLPVPLVHALTREHAQRHPGTHMMREPGLDYLDRLREAFGQVEEYDSAGFPASHQLYVYREDAAGFPLQVRPGVYKDIVPVCHR